jgi:hypothetical protein
LSKTGSKIRRRVAVVATVLGLAAGGVLVSASPAAAATSTCNGNTFWWSAKWNKYLYVPVYRNSAGVQYRGCQLRQGDGGTGGAAHAVFALQQALNVCYNENLTTDSDFGAHTKAALIRAQKREGVSADGIYGPQTADYLAFPFQSGDFIASPCHSFYG